MTTPDAQNAPARDDAQGPASTATTLSRLLGGWTRAQTARHPDAEPGAPEPGGGAEEPVSAEPVGGLDGAGPVPGPMSAPEAAAEDIEDDEDEDDVEEHVFATADPRDFADDSGPQYEDEDFDEAEGPDAEALGRPAAPAPVPVPSPAPAEEPAPPAPGASGPASPPDRKSVV